MAIELQDHEGGIISFTPCRSGGITVAHPLDPARIGVL